MEADKDTDVSLKAGGDILEVKPKTQRCTCQDYVFLISNRKILSKPGKDCDGQLLQVSGRGGGEVLDLNPKTVDNFYPSPRKAARASRLENPLSKLSWNIPANS